MSENKLNYFEVMTTTLVKARNKTEAEKIAMSNRRKVTNTPGEALMKQVKIDRITAVEAKQQITV